jgi:hypothetical protein
MRTPCLAPGHCAACGALGSFPILSFSGGAELAFDEPKDGSRRKSSKRLQLGEQKLAARDKLNRIPGAKMEILAEALLSAFRRWIQAVRVALDERMFRALRSSHFERFKV